MNVICRVLALVVTLCLVAHCTEGAPPSRSRRGGPRGSSRGDLWYDFPCPYLQCPSTAGCHTTEVVMWVHGTRLCEGCPYCLDRPGLKREVRAQSIRGGRFRRSPKISIDTMPIAQNEVCGFASCPLRRPSVRCSRPSILDGYLHGNKCISCAFCSDDVTPYQDGDQEILNELLNH